MDRDPTQRFSTRVDNYVKYRPGYPPALLALLERECGLTPLAVIADIGAGTGLLAALFLAYGSRVLGVEPNRAMREAGARLLAPHPGYTAVDGRAEATTLPARSVDFVTAGQAFHWFDPAAARAEFQRILRPGGWVALIWNQRRTESSAFLAGYEALLQTYAPEYPVHEPGAGAAGMRALFGAGGWQVAHFPNAQHLDRDGLQGRVLSSSYVPEPGHPNHAPMLAALADLFAAHEVDGQVTFEYDTEVYYGRLPGA
ncbi:MAG TPA: class I SAM-dependent methyltransferase [Chloroflexia bacterium]|nr:class I SAM-dependent methyltransferase [Chloroflexia bacterium]